MTVFNFAPEINWFVNVRGKAPLRLNVGSVWLLPRDKGVYMETTLEHPAIARAGGAFLISTVAHGDHHVFVWGYQKNSI